MLSVGTEGKERETSRDIHMDIQTDKQRSRGTEAETGVKSLIYGYFCCAIQ